MHILSWHCMFEEKGTEIAGISIQFLYSETKWFNIVKGIWTMTFSRYNF